MRLFPVTTLFSVPICFAFLLSSCYKPPYNNFEPANPALSDLSCPDRGLVNLFKSKKAALVQKLNCADIQYIEYGDTQTLIIPTDRYFDYDSPRLNELCYKSLNNILLLLRLNRCIQIHIAGFTDDIGTKHHRDKLTQARAETMLTYLWANGFKSAQLSAEGYGKEYPVANNKLVHGAAQNRRLEIQWTPLQNCRKPEAQHVYSMK